MANLSWYLPRVRLYRAEIPGSQYRVINIPLVQNSRGTRKLLFYVIIIFAFFFPIPMAIIRYIVKIYFVQHVDIVTISKYILKS